MRGCERPFAGPGPEGRLRVGLRKLSRELSALISTEHPARSVADGEHGLGRNPLMSGVARIFVLAGKRSIGKKKGATHVATEGSVGGKVVAYGEVL